MDTYERDALLAEIEDLRARLSVAPNERREWEEKLLLAKGQLSQAEAQRQQLANVLRDVREQVESLRQEVAQLSAPPSGYGVLLDVNSDNSLDVFVNGRKMRVTASPQVKVDDLFRGAEVVLNDSFNVVSVRTSDLTGEVATIEKVLEDGIRAVVSTRGDTSVVVTLSDLLRGSVLRVGDTYRLDARASVLIEKLPQPEVEDLLLEEVPNVRYSDIGGLDSQIEQIADAVELPYLHRELFSEYQLTAPKGILLYGPPGCGKTLIAKAVANSLAQKVSERTGTDKGRSYFINVKGPELLNKYVGETERHIRLIFQRAREKSEEGWPVIVFFDEMDSMFRARGTGISSDMESTIVPQLLAELDGVESLSNVIVIGATNREDLIDPAILRPGRLDVKIKIERPSVAAARHILGLYITSDIPIDDDLVKEHGDIQTAITSLISDSADAMYATTEENEFLEVTYQNGDKETLYYKDFSSGAMIENIVRRAKKNAIKRVLAKGSAGLKAEDIIQSIRDEFHENDDLPNTTNPDDWARISGKKGERIVFIRTLSKPSPSNEMNPGGKAIERTASGQYL